MATRQVIDQQQTVDPQLPSSPPSRNDTAGCLLALNDSLLSCLPASELQARDCSPHPSHQKSKTEVMVEVVPEMTNIIEYKFNGSNYLVWSKTVRMYLRSIGKNDHLTNDPPTDNTREAWLTDDARLLLQIRNSIETELIGLINRCDFVKELMDDLDSLYSIKGNKYHIYDICKSFFRAEQQNKSLQAYLMDFRRNYEEFNMLFPFSPDIKVQQAQREKMAIVNFLIGLSPEFEVFKSQILSESKISSLQEIFARFLRIENLRKPQPIANNSALVNHGGRRGDFNGGNKIGGMYNRNKNVDSRYQGDIACYYCHGLGHTKRTCKKLQNKHQKG